MVGDVPVGGESPISVQSMTNTDTRDVISTVGQVNSLQEAGADLVRISIPDEDSLKAFKKIKKETNLPLITDIHFDHKLALGAVKAGADCLRINPGNIGKKEKVLEVVSAAKDNGVPIRIGVNAGSLEKHEAKLSMIINNEKKATISSGNGPVDATFNAIKELTATNYRLNLYQVHAITAGTDAQGEVTVRLEDDQFSSQAKGSDPDIIVASAKAYISSLNRLIFKKSKSIANKTSEIKIKGV